jgi:BirA family transcriptional regulator, biotin operon repressor / biotin---[acetyl-CoA-carboxylase] ligase
VLTEEMVTRAAAEAGLPPRSRFVPATGSTNEDLAEAAVAGAPEWTALVAAEQRGGRGRLGRTWWSPPGTSMAVSILLRPRIPAHRTPLISLAAAAAMAAACRDDAQVDVLCKWPNDLLAGDRKVGGILGEASVSAGAVDHVVLGCGLNVLQRAEDFPPGFRSFATSLVVEGGRPDPFELLRDYFSGLRSLYGPGGSGLAHRVRSAYLPLCSTIGRAVRAVTVSGSTVQGVARDVGSSGELIVRDASGRTHAVGFGEVEHLG